MKHSLLYIGIAALVTAFSVQAIYDHAQKKVAENCVRHGSFTVGGDHFVCMHSLLEEEHE